MTGEALFVGIVTITTNVAIHSVTSGIVVEHLYWLFDEEKIRKHHIHGIRIMINTVIILFISHILQIVIWAAVFIHCGEFQSYRTAVYHSLVNYTTLGYGDIIMSARWRLLGPIEAACGILMFGWSTAIMFGVSSEIMKVIIEKRHSKTRHHSHNS